MLTEGVHSVVEFDQPAAADVGTAAGQASRPTSTTRSATAASSTSGASWSRCWSSRWAPACRSTKASSTSRTRRRRSRRSSPMSCCWSPSCSRAGRRWRRFASSRRPRAARLDRGGPPLEGSAGVHRAAGEWRGDGRHRRRGGRASFLAQVTGDPFYDGAASIVIGVILGVTAFVLAFESKGC